MIEGNAMTKHDEVRQILAQSGFKFDDGRSALEMTDEEVEAWLVHFTAVMGDLGRQMIIAMRSLAEAITNTVVPLQNLNQLLEEGEPEQQ
jgi:hypothetical protein